MIFASWVSLPENDAACLAAEGVLESLVTRGTAPSPSLLFLHGPSGTGKTYLVANLAEEASRRAPQVTVRLLTSDARGTRAEIDSEWASLFAHASQADTDIEKGAIRQADLLILEDLHHLPASQATTLVGLLDRRYARQQALVCTASVGPAQLVHLPPGLRNRLARGLVLGLDRLSPRSRQLFLEQRRAQRGLPVSSAVLAWLAGQIPGSFRQLEGALSKLEALCKLQGPIHDPRDVAEHFQAESESQRLTVEGIVAEVSRYFRIAPRQLRSRKRLPTALLARQVSMYLARKMLHLPLQQIGAYFGGYDHTTVLHACRKIDQDLTRNPALSDAVRHLQAELA
jgi:chromosomal replication initiator protein